MASSATTKDERPLFPADDVRLHLANCQTALSSMARQIEFCGGIRRGNMTAHDGDLVVWLDSPKNMQEAVGNLATLVRATPGSSASFAPTDAVEEFGGLRFDNGDRKSVEPEIQDKGGYKIAKIILGGIPIDVNFCFEQQQFEILKLIKTGNRNYNTYLAWKARQILPPYSRNADERMALKFSEGLFGVYATVPSWTQKQRAYVVNPARCYARTEKEVIELLEGRDYREPSDRNWTQQDMYEHGMTWLSAE